jgi:hypothetical protein
MMRMEGQQPPASNCDIPTRLFPSQIIWRQSMSKKDTYRVVTRAGDGTLMIRDYPDNQPLLHTHTQIGIDDCSTDLQLRGEAVFRGLIGPIPEGKNIIRYETPEVFEMLTKEWGSAKTRRRRRRTAAPDGIESAEVVVPVESAEAH